MNAMSDGFEYSREDQRLRREIISLVGKERLEKYRHIEIFRTIFDLLIIVLIFSLSFFVAIFMNYQKFQFTSLVMSALLAGVGFNWLNVQIHEASHFLLSNNKKLNDFVGNYVLGSFGIQSVIEYRDSHFIHHGHLNEEVDPDKHFYQSEISGKREFLTFLIKLGLGTAVIQKIKKGNWIPGSEDQNSRISDRTPYVTGVLVHFLIAGLLWFMFSTYAAISYFIVVIVGLACVFPVLLGIRTWIQHKDPRDALEISKERFESTPNFMSRTTITNLIERMIIGARMDYHFEHHLFSRIPHYNLKRLHSDLARLGYFETDEKSQFVTENYLKSSLLIAGERN